jgi:translation initiation factor 1 (eIF-1/SUI1)
MEEEFSINELSFKPTSNFMGQEEQGITAKMIRNILFKKSDISIKQRSTRKCLTIIEGIPDDIDLKKVVKAWKNVSCFFYF